MATMVADLFARLGLKPDKKEWDKGSELIDGVKTALKFFVGFEIVKSIGEMVGSVVELGGQIHDTAEQIGISAESLQELSFGAKEAGVNMEFLAGGLRKLSKGLVESARTGKGPVADAFSAMGISMSSVRDKLKGEGGLDDVLGLVADKFQTMPPGMTKTALAMDLFGKSGNELIPFLDQGSAGINALREKANELGVVMSGDAVNSLDDFGDSLDETKATFQGLKQQLVVALLPVLREMLEGFRTWIAANRELIASTLATVVQGLTYAFQALGAVIGFVSDVIAYFVDHAELGESVIIALGVVIAAFAVKAAASWIIAFAPVIAIIAVITGIVLAIKMLIKHWDKVRAVVGRVWRFIADGLTAAWNVIKSVGQAIADFFVGVADTIKGAFTDAFDWVAEKIQWLVDQVKAVIDQLDAASKKRLNQLGVKAEDQSTGAKAAATFMDAAIPAPLLDWLLPDEPSTPPPAAGEPSAMNTPTIIRGGDVKIDITTGSGDAKEIAAVVQEKIDESMQAWLQQTHEVVG